MKQMTRRGAFSMAVAAAAVTLSGCKTISEGNVQQTYVDVAKIKAYVAAGVAAAGSAILIANQFPFLTAYTARLETVIATLQSSIVEFDKTVGDEIIVSIDKTSVKTIVESIFKILTDLNDVFFVMMLDSQVAADTIPHDVFDKIKLMSSSLGTIIAILRAVLMPIFSRPNLQTTSFEEAKALRVLSA